MTTLALRSTASSSTANTARWGGRVLTALPVLFLALDGVTKLLAVQPVAEAMAQLGFRPAQAFGIGSLLLACLAVYVVPRTSLVGAVLLTAYLGGAVAAHVRIGSPLATHTLFPVYVALMLWGGLYLRDPRLRALLFPPRSF